ncbi:MAG: hypothetical protein IKA32_10040 [Lentisphaeria bacterium]|nr:hypothetical protein [Lentisphaeria bacterium]
MKNKIIFLVFVSGSILFGDTILDVCKFGAVPNDGKDDTAAVEKALQQAFKRRRGYRNGRYVSAPAVHFPYGQYHLSRPLKVPACAALTGEGGGTFLIYTGSKNDTVFTVEASTQRVENLIFCGGKTHLQFSNPNWDTTLITIRNCRFLNASGVAVRIIPSGNKDHMSALTLIENAVFEGNYQCVENTGDLFKIRDSWVQLKQPQMADGAAFINRSGRMMLENVCGVPSANPPKGKEYLQNVRWIDNYGAIRCNMVRFGGEGGGIPIVYHYGDGRRKTSHLQGNGKEIIIENSEVYPGQLKRKNRCVMRLFELPSQIRYEGNHGHTDRPVIILEPALAERLKKNPPGKDRTTFFFSYSFRNNTGAKLQIPEVLHDLISADSEINRRKK